MQALSFRSEKGISMLEFVILAAVFVIIFVGASVYLRAAGQSRANESMEVGNTYIPCGTGALTGDQCL